LTTAEAELLVGERELADFYEQIVALTGEPKLTCNWIVGEFMRLLHESGRSLAQRPVTNTQLAELLLRLQNKELTGPMAKEVLAEMWVSGESVDAVLERKGLRQVKDDRQIEAWVDQVIVQNPKVVHDYLSGKDKLFGFFVGQVMKLSKSQANPELVNQKLKERLK
jgi:aspartyl-tRNA(Asn)/glutamyl-tRNA(Gln) amidotransferase subunit B